MGDTTLREDLDVLDEVLAQANCTTHHDACPCRQGAMKARIAELEAECERLKKGHETRGRLLKDICSEWNEDCNETCDSIAHDEDCKAVNIAAAKMAMRERISALEAALKEADSVFQRLINKVNKVTAWHRGSAMPMPKERLDELNNRQIDCENAWNEIRSKLRGERG